MRGVFLIQEQDKQQNGKMYAPCFDQKGLKTNLKRSEEYMKVTYIQIRLYSSQNAAGLPIKVSKKVLSR
jgi:hypothetical protein